jgi:8-oxo-dGTP pyrophosphatase MutT (NUDIX family)
VNPLLDLLYRLQRQLWRVFRPRTRGVKVMLFNDAGEIMLIRNSYGRSDLFVLPGGGIRPFEAPAAAAAREVKEELGCGVADLDFVATFFATAQGKRDTVHLFRARAGGPARADGVEVAEARFFPLDGLPPQTSPATARRMAEHRGASQASSAW